MHGPYMPIRCMHTQASAKKGKLSEAQVESLMSRISTASSFEDTKVKEADVVVEAAFERMAVKKVLELTTLPSYHPTPSCPTSYFLPPPSYQPTPSCPTSHFLLAAHQTR